MKIIYTKTHRRHAPPYEFIRNNMRPYSESPTRADKIHQVLQEEGFIDLITPRKYSLDPIQAVHDSHYLHYLENIYAAWLTSNDDGNSKRGIIPDTFAFRTMDKRPQKLMNQTGYYCFDTQTPVVEATYEVALSSAFCALTGADLLLEGNSTVYALCRPPGHHAGHDTYGGYCYLNNAAIAATHLSRKKAKVAVLDIDYHHGNGTQDIFYHSSQVLVVSIHADPNREFKNSIQ